MFKKLKLRLLTYFRRLLFPLYLFPLKLLTYSLYYLLRALGRLTWSLLLILFDMLIYPFLGLRHFLKSLFLLALLIYLALSLLVISDYLVKEYPNLSKFYCSNILSEREIPDNIVRVVAYGSGSGFFITPNQVLTNYHVIKGSSSPKVILPDDSIVGVATISANMQEDLAIITTRDSYRRLVYNLGDSERLVEGEQVISKGYAWEAGIEHKPITLTGTYGGNRNNTEGDYVLTDIGLVRGMSGGPLLDKCGDVVGVNTAGIGGLSMFIGSYRFKLLWPTFSSEGLKTISVDPTLSPEDGVKAFYTYLAARDMQSSFDLLSKEYLNFTDINEWSARFTDILDINVLHTEGVEDLPDTVFVKFITKTWTGTEVVYKFYEGVWVTKLEDSVYKMRRSMIKEVADPPWDWQYTGPEF